MRLLKKYFNRENKFSLKERFNMVMTVVTCFFMGVMSENGRGMQGIKGLIDGIGGYVLTAVVTFIAATVITVICIKTKNRGNIK